MNDKKFKVGDRVRIIKTSLIEPYELNKVGTIISIMECEEWFTYTVDMGRPRRSSEPSETCWYLRESMIELLYKQKQQLLFEFMNEQ